MRSFWEKFVRGIEIFVSILFAALVLDVLWGVISPTMLPSFALIATSFSP